MSKTGSIRPESAASTIQPGGPVAESRPATRTLVSMTTFIRALGAADFDERVQ